MGLIRQAMIVAILGTMFLGIPAVNAQVSIEMPQFKSGASAMMGVPVDFKILNQRVGAIYDVVESNESHIVWKFSGSTGDWAFVFADGRIVVASTVDFDLATKDTLSKELNDVMDMLNTVNAAISTEARNNALDATIYYSSEPEIYHRLKYDFKSNFDFTLVVPDCTVKKARLTILGGDVGTNQFASNPGQIYTIDGKNVASCDAHATMLEGRFPCSVSPVDIADKIPAGLHRITADLIDNEHTMTLEAITSPLPPKKFVLYGPNYIPWINETSKSMTLSNMNSLIMGSAPAINTT